MRWWDEWAEPPQRQYDCPNLPQLKNFVLLVSSGEVLSPLEARLILEHFRFFCSHFGWKSFISVLNILLPTLLFLLFLALVQKKVVFVVLAFCFRKILIMSFSLKEHLVLIAMF